MKKILLLLLVIFPLDIYALEFFTNYELYKENTTEIINENELIKKETIYLYNNYTNERYNEKYYELNKNDSKSPFIDQKDYILTTKKYQEKDDESTYINNVYKVNQNSISKVRYLKISNISKNTIIENIKIYNKEEEIEYEFIKKINFKEIYLNGEIIIDFKNEIDFEDLKIELNFINDSDTINYRFALGQKHYLFTYPQVYLDYNIELTNKDKHIVNTYLLQENYNEIINNIDWIKDKEVNNFSYYDKYIKLYKYYNLKKVYLNEYTVSVIDGYIHDKEDKQEKFNYYKRDKIVVEDNILDLNNIIKYTTIKELNDIKTEIIYNNPTSGIIKILYKDNVFFKEFNINNKEELIVDNTLHTTTKKINQKPVNYKIQSNTTKKVTTSQKTETKHENNIKVSSKNDSKNHIVKYFLIIFIICIILFIFDRYIHQKKD